MHVRLSSAPGVPGAENSLILSRYKLTNSDSFILPSTLYRRSVLYSQVQLEDQSVDFYCGFLMTTENAGVLPYNGNYGNGPIQDPDPSTQGWENEQLYEAQLLINWEQKKSGSNPAIVVGDWHSQSRGTGTAPPGTFAATALNPATMNLFGNTTSAPNWQFATPSTTSGSAWQPQCNVCPPPENPYNGPTDQYFFSQPMLVNWPQAKTATIDESLLYTQGVTSLGGDAGQGPLSPYFGVNFKVIRPH